MMYNVCILNILDDIETLSGGYQLWYLLGINKDVTNFGTILYCLVIGHIEIYIYYLLEMAGQSAPNCWWHAILSLPQVVVFVTLSYVIISHLEIQCLVLQ